MRYRKTRRFRQNSNNRGYQPRRSIGENLRMRPNTFSNDRHRNNFKSNQNAEKLVEKYNALAKEALSSGDRVLSENYFQHADHFIRIIESRALNQNQSNLQVVKEPQTVENLAEENRKTAEEEKQK